MPCNVFLLLEIHSHSLIFSVFFLVFAFKFLHFQSKQQCSFIVSAFRFLDFAFLEYESATSIKAVKLFDSRARKNFSIPFFIERVGVGIWCSEEQWPTPWKLSRSGVLLSGPYFDPWFWSFSTFFKTQRTKKTNAMETHMVKHLKQTLNFIRLFNLTFVSSFVLYSNPCTFFSFCCSCILSFFYFIFCYIRFAIFLFGGLLKVHFVSRESLSLFMAFYLSAVSVFFFWVNI